MVAAVAVPPRPPVNPRAPRLPRLCCVAAGALRKVEEALVPGASQQERKEWCLQRLVECVEAVDQLTPGIGPWLDTRLADRLERRVLEALVEQVWQQLHEHDHGSGRP